MASKPVSPGEETAGNVCPASLESTVAPCLPTPTTPLPVVKATPLSALSETETIVAVIPPSVVRTSSLEFDPTVVIRQSFASLHVIDPRFGASPPPVSASGSFVQVCPPSVERTSSPSSPTA